MTNREQGLLKNGDIIKNKEGEEFVFVSWENPNGMFFPDFMNMPNKKANIVDYKTVKNNIQDNMDDYE